MGGVFVRTPTRASRKNWPATACSTSPAPRAYLSFLLALRFAAALHARETWYVRTSAYRDRLVALNQEINWYPGTSRTGAFRQRAGEQCRLGAGP